MAKQYNDGGSGGGGGARNGEKSETSACRSSSNAENEEKSTFFEARVAALYYRGTLYRFLIVFWVFFCLKAEALYIV